MYYLKNTNYLKIKWQFMQKICNVYKNPTKFIEFFKFLKPNVITLKSAVNWKVTFKDFPL